MDYSDSKKAEKGRSRDDKWGNLASRERKRPEETYRRLPSGHLRSRLAFFVVGNSLLPVCIRQVIHPEFFENGGAIEAEPLGCRPAIALDAAHHLFQKGRLNMIEHFLVEIGGGVRAGRADAFGQPLDHGGGKLLRGIGGGQ